MKKLYCIEFSNVFNNKNNLIRFKITNLGKTIIPYDKLSKTKVIANNFPSDLERQSK